MKHRQAGLTLIELMVALALTAVLGIMLAALVNGWLKVRERLQVTNQETSVLDLCLALERRFDSPVMRRVYDQRLPLASRWLDWQPASNQLLWVAITGMPEAEGGSRLQRQRLRFEAREQRLLLESSADLYAAAAPRWVPARAARPGQRHECSLLPGRPLAGLAFRPTCAPRPWRASGTAA
ncbi:type II secretion system protein J [Pseudomonas putida S11]|nr:type II secretion system protein J [Pseudomonas putida S11]